MSRAPPQKKIRSVARPNILNVFIFFFLFFFLNPCLSERYILTVQTDCMYVSPTEQEMWTAGYYQENNFSQIIVLP